MAAILCLPQCVKMLFQINPPAHDLVDTINLWNIYVYVIWEWESQLTIKITATKIGQLDNFLFNWLFVIER